MEDMKIQGPLLAKQFNSMRNDMYVFISPLIPTELIIASVIDVVRAPYVSIDTHFFPALLSLLFNSDSFDIGSFFQLHDLDR
jgi:hypothetical protein